MINQYKGYDEKYFQDSSDRHISLTQYYRLFEIFERHNSNNKDFLDLLMEDVKFKDSSKQLVGRKALLEYAKHFSEVSISYHTKEVTVTSIADGKYMVTADILCQQDDVRHQNKDLLIQCKLILIEGKKTLPLIESIELNSVKNMDCSQYKDSYAYNRARAIAHFWIYILENLDEYIDCYDEIIAPEFLVQTKTGDKITSMDDYRTWLRAGDARVSYTSHQYKSFEVISEENGEIEIKFNFDWQGYSIDHQPMIAESQHRWIILDNPENRFACIKEIEMYMIIPFTIEIIS